MALTNKPRLVAVSLFSFGVMTGYVVASPAKNARIEHHRADLSGAPEMEVIMSSAEYTPGTELPRHFHHGLEAVYVIQGASIKMTNNSLGQLTSGTSLLQLREVTHAGFTVTGEQSLKLFTVHIVDKDKPLYATPN